MTSVVNSPTGTTDYSVEDLEFDCDLLMSETEDINLNWMNVVFTKKRNQTKEETALNNAVDKHAKTMRYLSFAKSVIEVEIDKLSVKEIDGDIIVVSQFTLQALTKKGNRPSYIKAAKPEVAIPVYEDFVLQLEKELGKKVQTGVFGADMKVALLNDGPVTILIDSKCRN